MISSLTWWILAVSILIALIIMFISIIIVRFKISQIKNKYSNKNIIRKNVGELLWDLKEKSKNPLDDYSMEYSLNTCIRNKYKNFLIKGFIEIYEEETLKKIAKVKKVSKNYQFALINFNDKTINEIKKIYDNSSKKSLILIVNLKNKKTKKEIMSYLKLLKIRHEFQKIGQGIILIAK